MVTITDETVSCPECGGRQLQSTPPNKDGRWHICAGCQNMWHVARRRSTSVGPTGRRKTRRSEFARWTYEEALAQFHRAFPEGFSDPAYLRRERDWKWAKHELWCTTVGADGIGALAKSSPEAAARLIEKMLQTKAAMLNPPGEIVPMRDAVHRPEQAVGYFETLGSLLEAPVLTADLFDDYVEALTSIPLIGSGNLAKWTIVTFIPFLAQPSRHMFLKPGRTREATARLGKDILYSPTVKWDTYERLLAFSNELLDFLRPQGAQDMIDVQSFIWATTARDED